jgi:hypothetical protein
MPMTALRRLSSIDALATGSREVTPREAAATEDDPEVRDLWEKCAAAKSRSLTNLFEVMVRDRTKALNIRSQPGTPQARKTPTQKTKS